MFKNTWRTVEFEFDNYYPSEYRTYGMGRLELRELGSSVGWVEFDPYEYEFSGDSNNARLVLEDGPPETVRVGQEPPEELEQEDGVSVHSDTVRETTVEERKEILVNSLARVGVVVEPPE